MTSLGSGQPTLRLIARTEFTQLLREQRIFVRRTLARSGLGWAAGVIASAAPERRSRAFRTCGVGAPVGATWLRNASDAPQCECRPPANISSEF